MLPQRLPQDDQVTALARTTSLWQTLSRVMVHEQPLLWSRKRPHLLGRAAADLAEAGNLQEEVCAP